jgi:exonuclease III
VKRDVNVKSADVACFAETRLCMRDSEESTEIFNFHQYRQDAPQNSNQRPYHGLALYSAENLSSIRNVTTNSIEAILFDIPQTDIKILTLYKPPKVRVHDVCSFLFNIYDKHLRGKESIVMGDFNINWSSVTDRKPLEDCMIKTLGFSQEIKTPTTDYQSTLDLVFHNLKRPVLCGTREVYYSDHKMIYAAW